VTTRRQFNIAVPGLVVGAVVNSGCSKGPDAYEVLAAKTWQQGLQPDSGIAALKYELVRYATLAPSSHNTQCWKFKVEDRAITLLPDFSRRCPAVDPDDHHLFISLGCAAENLVTAASAYGLQGNARYDAVQEAIRVELTPTRNPVSPLFQAISDRQSTRGDYDGRPLTSAELELLMRAGMSNSVGVLFLNDRPAMERTLEQTIEANTAQMADAAFVNELKSWVRFNGAEAAQKRDGLFSLTTGNPAVPTWLGELAFGMLFRPKSENDKIARQVRSSSGIAVFTGQSADKANWVEVGRCYERFALQATALGIRSALLNQPVEVPSARKVFAASLGLGDQRPDLVVRFGRGPGMPRSLRRPLGAILQT
jgi:hypothetical protein